MAEQRPFMTTGNYQTSLVVLFPCLLILGEHLTNRIQIYAEKHLVTPLWIMP